jgi:hypothetical protein
VFSQRPPNGAWTLAIISADGQGEAKSLTTGAVSEWQGRVSPDGKLIACVSDRGMEAGNEAGHLGVRARRYWRSTANYPRFGRRELPRMGAEQCAHCVRSHAASRRRNLCGPVESLNDRGRSGTRNWKRARRSGERRHERPFG